MMKQFQTLTLLFLGLSLASVSANAATSTVPEPFQGFDDSSKYVIRYDDLTALLSALVVDTGRSTREVAQPTQAKTGTLMKAKVKRSTANEANRVYFDTLMDSEEGQQFLFNIQQSLMQVPTDAPLKYFSRDEQLAYWLNLYNVTVLSEIVKAKSKRNLKKMLVGRNSILPQKLLTVAGIQLSLDDIQHTILKQNYNGNPLIIYGLYQGNIGGPNIRKRAYTGKDVYRALENNAIEFINSNRGTYSKNEQVFRVSSLYDRNRDFFPSFESDLRKHLMVFLEGYERTDLQAASTIKADIDDWTITSIEGAYREFGSSVADSNAALLDSVKSTVASTNTGGGAATLGASAGYGSASMASKGKPYNRIDPELLEQLLIINEKRLNENQKNATVTVEELGQVGVDKEPEPEPENPDGKN